MSNSALGSLAFFLFATLLSAHFLGHLFVRMRQPKVIGEILAGVLMGPSVIGHFWRLMPSGTSPNSLPTPLELCYWVGLLLLMFFSGAETQNLFRRNDNREVTLLALLGTGLPFIIALGLASMVKLQPLAGSVGTGASLTLVVGIAVAVTSIPVISRIFHDLGILQTRFARLVLGVAVIEDIALWAVLAIATAIAKSATQTGLTGVVPMAHISREILTTLVFFALGLTLVPRLLQRLHNSRWNSLGSASPAAYLLVLLFAYVSIAAALNVSLVFAAFLAGLAVPRPNEADKTESSFYDALKSVKTVSFSIFIPIYFALVGYKIDWSKSFSLSMLLMFLAGACLIKLASVLLGAYAAGFRGLDAINLAVATNARGGPGIVLASVAFDAQIISPAFYTTLILVAVFTSQAAGAWLEYVLRKGWPLLSGSQEAITSEPVLQPVPVQRAA